MLLNAPLFLGFKSLGLNVIGKAIPLFNACISIASRISAINHALIAK